MAKESLSQHLGTYLELEDVERVVEVDALLEVETLEDVDTLNCNANNMD